MPKPPKLWLDCPIHLLDDIRAVVDKWGLEKTERALKNIKYEEDFFEQLAVEMTASGQISPSFEAIKRQSEVTGEELRAIIERSRRIFEAVGGPPVPRDPCANTAPGRRRIDDDKHVAHMGYLVAQKGLSVHAASMAAVADLPEHRRESAAARLRRKYREEGRGGRWAGYWATPDQVFIDRLGGDNFAKMQIATRMRADYPDISE